MTKKHVAYGTSSNYAIMNVNSFNNFKENMGQVTFDLKKKTL